MATEASNILTMVRTFAERQKEEELDRQLADGPLGYSGGLSGFIDDMTAGVLTRTALKEGGEAIKDAFDTRTQKEIIQDEVEAYREAIGDANLGAIDIFGYGLAQMKAQGLDTSGVESLYNQYLQGTTLTTVDGNGNKIQYQDAGPVSNSTNSAPGDQVGKFNPFFNPYGRK